MIREYRLADSVAMYVPVLFDNNDNALQFTVWQQDYVMVFAIQLPVSITPSKGMLFFAAKPSVLQKPVRANRIHHPTIAAAV
ncbi:hypothetical protein [Gordonia aquimaris]|uniref:Uncharacterized protein n=1 Tax=Gordonia aquimaris TaxID=2984863 RepID=A0A9X3D5E2_9ACTN|nr:hypothetical protein [Gordonia aquimaris]MCX2965394.1 hypothetical protein [Gordonia aquimaris]